LKERERRKRRPKIPFLDGRKLNLGSVKREEDLPH